MNELALFAGAGGGILGSDLLAWRTVCAVERDAYAAQVLAQRQNDRVLRPFPIWSDVTSFDGTRWRGIVDVVSGGFPCQDISAAGMGAGINGKRSGLWTHMARIIREVQPIGVLVENSAMLTSRGLGRVLGDLASLGFDAEWGVVSAADTGAPHLRERIWIVGHAQRVRQHARWYDHAGHEWPESGPAGQDTVLLADADCRHKLGRHSNVQVGRFGGQRKAARHGYPERIEWPLEPDVGRVADGVANRLDRIKALGNGQVPRVAATAFNILS